MTTDKAKFIAVLDRLLEKSSSDKVNWLESYSPYSPDGRVYLVELKESRISVERVSPSAEPDYIMVEVCGKVGGSMREIASLSSQEGDDNWARFSKLHAEAERRATGWEKVLQSIELELSADGVIGATTSNDFGNVRGCDIPF